MIEGIAILQGIKAIWDTFPIFKKLWTRFHEFFVTFLAMMVCWAGLNIVRERDLTAGLRAAFTDSSYTTSSREIDTRSAVMQEELKKIAQSNATVRRIMEAELTNTPEAARVRLGIIHNGVYGVTGIGLLRFDLTQAVSKSGRSDGDMAQNAPLSQWDDYLQPLISGECSYVKVQDMKNSSARAHMEDVGISAFTACPVIDSHNQVLGALFVSWDKNDPLPSEEEVKKLEVQHLRAATQVAGAMEIRH